MRREMKTAKAIGGGPARAAASAPVASAPAASKSKSQRLSSVTTSVRLLKSFSEGEAEIGVTTLSKRLGVAKSTVYRLASTLVSEGMLEQNRENDKYRLGLALFGLGALVRQRMNVSTEARPHIFALREATNETVHLAVALALAQVPLSAVAEFFLLAVALMLPAATQSPPLQE